MTSKRQLIPTIGKNLPKYKVKGLGTNQGQDVVIIASGSDGPQNTGVYLVFTASPYVITTT